MASGAFWRLWLGRRWCEGAETSPGRINGHLISASLSNSLSIFLCGLITRSLWHWQCVKSELGNQVSFFRPTVVEDWIWFVVKSWSFYHLCMQNRLGEGGGVKSFFTRLEHSVTLPSVHSLHGIKEMMIKRKSLFFWSLPTEWSLVGIKDEFFLDLYLFGLDPDKNDI